MVAVLWYGGGAWEDEADGEGPEEAGHGDKISPGGFGQRWGEKKRKETRREERREEKRKAKRKEEGENRKETE